MDLTRIKAKLTQLRSTLADGNRQEAEKVGWELVEAMEADYEVKSVEDYTPEVAAVQYEVMAALLELHILRGDKLDVSVRAAQLVKKYKEDRAHLTAWKEEEWEEINRIVRDAAQSARSFIRPMKKLAQKPTRTQDCACLLCRSRKAGKTGSHLVPHLLIGDTFSYDGSNDRDKAVVEEANLASGTRDWYYGRSVYDDTVQELRGEGFTDEELQQEQQKTNLLTRDFVFCEECEKRFGTIESYYSDYLAGKTVPDAVPYLFWLSVAWRMSAGGLGIKMLPANEEKLRKILDRCLALKREDIVLKKSKLDYCAYLLSEAPDTRDETLGILAIHTPTSPYIALIGHRLFRFFMTESSAKTYCKKNDRWADEMNTGRAPEIVGSLSFLEFWQFKRFILDCNWRDDVEGENRNQTAFQYKAISQGEAEFMSRIGAGEFDHDAHQLDFGNRVGVVPRAVRNILRWIDEHPDDKSAEALSAGTGYSSEELKVILEYWVSKAAKDEQALDREEKLHKVFDEVLDKL